MSGLVLFWLLLVAAIAALPGWPYSRGWSLRPSGVASALLLLWLGLVSFGGLSIAWPLGDGGWRSEALPVVAIQPVTPATAASAVAADAPRPQPAVALACVGTGSVSAAGRAEVIVTCRRRVPAVIDRRPCGEGETADRPAADADPVRPPAFPTAAGPMRSV